MPMPWVLGAMTFTLVAGLGGFDLRMERGWRNAFVPVLGVMLGSLFNPASIGGFTTVAVMLPLVLAHLAIAVGLGYVFFRRRSEERRVGKGCVSTCRSWWWPFH